MLASRWVCSGQVEPKMADVGPKKGSYHFLVGFLAREGLHLMPPTRALSLAYRWLIAALSLAYRWLIAGLSLAYRWLDPSGGLVKVTFFAKTFKILKENRCFRKAGCAVPLKRL